LDDLGDPVAAFLGSDQAPWLFVLKALGGINIQLWEIREGIKRVPFTIQKRKKPSQKQEMLNII